jgi:hypothetical protein
MLLGRLKYVLSHRCLNLELLRLTLSSKSWAGRLRLKCGGTRAESRFRLSAKRTSPFKSAGVSVQSTTGSRGVRISGSNVGYTMFRGSVKGTGYAFHSPVSPSLYLPASPRAITFQLDSINRQVLTEFWRTWSKDEVKLCVLRSRNLLTVFTIRRISFAV